MREKKAIDDMMFFKRELINREENFNRRFTGRSGVRVNNTIAPIQSSSPLAQVGVLQVLDGINSRGRKKRTATRQPGNNKIKSWRVHPSVD